MYKILQLKIVVSACKRINRHRIISVAMGLVFLIPLFFFTNSHAQRVENNLYFNQLIQSGDSFLNLDKFEQARSFYAKANAIFSSDYYRLNYLNYKVGYSYLAQDEGFLALAYFTDILLSFSPENNRDSAFKLLVTTEADLLTIEVLSPAYDFDGLKKNFYSCRNLLTAWEKSRFEFLIGEIYFKRLDYSNAIKSYKRSLSIQQNDLWLKEWAWFNIGAAYYELLDYSKSADVFFYLQNSEYMHIGKHPVLCMLGKNYMAGKEYKNAIACFEKALKFSHFKRGMSKDVQAYIYIGNCYLSMGKLQKAYEMYNKAELFCIQQKIVSKEFILPLIAKGNYYGIVGDFEQQQNYLSKALENLDKKDDIILRSTVVENLAKTFYQFDKYDELINLVNDYVDKYSSISQLDLKNTIGWTLLQSILKYRALSAYHIWQVDSSDTEMLQQSYNYFNEVLNVVSDGFSSMESEESKKDELKRIREVYSDAFIVTYDLYCQTSDINLLDELFALIESSKGNLFKANFRNSKAIEYSGIPAESIKQAGVLKKQIEWLRYNLNNISDENEIIRNIPKLRKELAFTEMRYDSLIDVLETEFPQYYSARISTHEYRINTIQKNIHRNQALLDYYLIGDRLFIFYISRNNTELQEIIVGKNFVNDIIDFRSFIQQPSAEITCDSAYYNFGMLSNKLYNCLISPVNKRVKDMRLIIIPDREINLIPFHTLLTDTSGICLNDFSKLNFLVYFNPVTTLYSAEQLFTKQKKLTNKSRYLGLAPRYLPEASKPFENLPGADLEIKKTAEYFKGVSFVGLDATKNNFLENCSGFDIIHMALHTDINPVEPLYSKLFFSSENSAEPESMLAYEIFEYPMHAKLLVLSGCNTGFGNLEFGEGMLNLARTFFYNGVENIIATHWSVADKSSSNLMGYFYNYLSKSEPVDIAMQKAKIEFLKSEDPLRCHPYFWAGYISVGNPVVYKSYRWVWFLTFPLMLVFGLVYYLKRLHGQLINPE